MGRRALACLAVLAVGGCGGGGGHRPQRTVDPAQHAAKASGPRLTPAVARKLEADFRSQVKDSGVPGATAAIVFPDGREWTSAQGLAVLHPARAMTARTAFSLDDVTTLPIAALALRLAEQGRLSLDDRVSRWYPAWRGGRRATVRDLLGQTSGAQDPPGPFFDFFVRHLGRTRTPRQLLAAAPKPGRRPQEGEYSNAAFVIAGLILARAGGASPAALLRRDVFDHPGGGGLVLQPQERPHAPFAHDYWYPRGLSRPTDVTGDGGYVPARAFAGMLSASAGLAGDDLSLARWAHALLGGHILQPASLRAMTDFRPFSTFYSSYGLGLAQSSSDGHELWGASGNGIGSHTELWHLPREDLTVAVSWNDDLIDSDAPMLRTLVRNALG